MRVYGIDLETGEVTDREMTDEEISELPPIDLASPSE